MPYASVDELPADVQKLSDKDQRQWRQIFNSAYARAKAQGKSDTEAESSAFAQANGVVRGGGSAEHSRAVIFDAAPAPLYEDGELVYRGGLVFRPGNYPDKAYSMTPDEIRAAASAFEHPVPIDLEHVPTVLNGKLGEVVFLDAPEDGSMLTGIVAMPKWLDQAIGPTDRKVSATWNRASKRLEGLALVLNPRVPDAALMAAFGAATGTPVVVFAEWDTAYMNNLPDSSFLWIADGGSKDDEGKTVPRDLRYLPFKNAQGDVDLAHLRNAISRLGQEDTGKGTSMPKDSLLKKAQGILERANASVDGAVVDAAQLRQLADFAAARHDTPEGQLQLQMVHDAAARGGAVCNPPDSARMAAQHEASALQQIHDIAAGHGAQCSSGGQGPGSPAIPYSTKKEGFMSGIRDRIQALFQLVPEEQLAALLPEAVTGSGGATATVRTDAVGSSIPNVSMSDSERMLRDELTATRDENRRIRAERIAEQAAMFADHYITGEHKAFPTEREAIVQGYIQAATDDLLLPGSVTFADGRAGSRVAVLKSMYDARPAHQLTAEQLAPGIFAALANRDTTASDASRASEPVDDKTLRNLIGRTTLGKAVLDHTDRGGVATDRNGKS